MNISNKKRCLVIGDLHCRDFWKELLRRHFDQVDKVIFVGDYVDSFDETDSQMIKTLSDVITFKKANMNCVELLLGNHCSQYMWLENRNFRCKGFRPEISGVIHHLFAENKELFNFAVQLDNTIVSHAGICADWLKRFRAVLEPYSILVTPSNVVKYMNMCLHERVSREALECIGQVGKSRGGDESVGGPLWADKSDLKKNYIYGVNQIIGHTFHKDLVPYTHDTDDNHTLRFIDISEGALKHPCIIEYETFNK